MVLAVRVILRSLSEHENLCCRGVGAIVSCYVLGSFPSQVLPILYLGAMPRLADYVVL